MKMRLLSALFAIALALALPVSSAWAAPGDLDEIVDYTITVDVNDDATLNMEYHIEWKVLDSTSEGPLTWVQIGIPNNHCRSFVGLTDSVKEVSYSTAGGSYARIDLDRAYHAGEVASFDFSFVQDYMYEVGRDNQGEAVYEFIPGWFDDIAVDNLTVKWNADKVQRIAPAAPLVKARAPHRYFTTRMVKNNLFLIIHGLFMAFHVKKLSVLSINSPCCLTKTDADALRKIQKNLLFEKEDAATIVFVVFIVFLLAGPFRSSGRHCPRYWGR